MEDSGKVIDYDYLVENGIDYDALLQAEERLSRRRSLDAPGFRSRLRYAHETGRLVEILKEEGICLNQLLAQRSESIL